MVVVAILKNFIVVELVVLAVLLAAYDMCFDFRNKLWFQLGEITRGCAMMRRLRRKCAPVGSCKIDTNSWSISSMKWLCTSEDERVSLWAMNAVANLSDERVSQKGGKTYVGVKSRGLSDNVQPVPKRSKWVLIFSRFSLLYNSKFGLKIQIQTRQDIRRRLLPLSFCSINCN